MHIKFKKIIWLFLSSITLLIGLMLLFNNQIKNEMVRQNQVIGLKSLTKKSIQKNKHKKGMFNYSKVKEIGWKQVFESKQSGKNRAYSIGALSIPSVGMYLPIENGLSNVNLSTGGCTMREDQVMGKGNYPLAGHYMLNNGSILFSPLERTKIGQRIYLTDLNKIYVYQINMKQIVSPKAVWLIHNTPENIVTLITCANGGKMRWAIRGILIGETIATKQNLKSIGL